MDVRIFDQQGFYTEVHNAILDVVLPAIPPNAFKVLLVITRQTKGWQRKVVMLSIHQIMRLAGIGSEHTAQAAIEALLKFQQHGKPKPLIIEQRPDKWSPRVFGLNRGISITWLPVAENATGSVAESATHIRKEKNFLKKKSSRSKSTAAAAADKSHVSRFDHQTILAWIEATRENVKNPGGLARTIGRSNNDDKQIAKWLNEIKAIEDKKESIKNKEKLEAERIRQELEAWDRREKACKAFLQSLSQSDYDRRFLEASQFIKASLKPEQRLFFDPESQIDSIEYRMFALFESQQSLEKAA